MKAGADEQPPVELTPLDTPEVTYDQEGSTASSVRFSWPAVESAVRYEYTYTCLNCGEVVESRSGETEETNVVFDGLIAGTSCSLTVRALPAEEDTTYEASEWCEPVEGTVKSSVTGVDSHPVGYALLEDDLSWVTVGVYGQESFVDTYPGNPAGIRFDKVSAAGKTLLEEKGWEMTSSNSAAYLYAGSIKLGTSSAVGSVFTPRGFGHRSGYEGQRRGDCSAVRPSSGPTTITTTMRLPLRSRATEPSRTVRRAWSSAWAVGTTGCATVSSCRT